MGAPMKFCLVLGGSPQADLSPLADYLPLKPYVLCADGGQVHAKILGLTPDFVLGDWDSSQCPPIEVPHCTLPCEKDMTDLQGALQMALEMGYTDFLLCGCTGGRLDHTSFNLYLLEWLHQNGGKGILLDGTNQVQYLSKGTMMLTKHPRYRYLSILPLDGRVEGVSLDGVKYPLDNATLYRGDTRTVSNEILADCCTIAVVYGSILVFRST